MIEIRGPHVWGGEKTKKQNAGVRSIFLIQPVR